MQQATRPRQEESTLQLTQSKSLVLTKTAIRAAIACIAAHRQLLPADAFKVVKLCAPWPPGREPKQTWKKDERLNVYDFDPSCTDEAQKMLRYMEEGIFHALEKQYLRSVVMAIYLDKEDPQNVIEAYTLNFDYHKGPDGQQADPVMTWEVKGAGQQLPNGPTKHSSTDGYLRDVKILTKQLMSLMGLLQPLPRSRYTTFKLYYNDSTPADYEPPHFVAANPDHRLMLGTYDVDEMPWREKVGAAHSAYHSVDISIASLASGQQLMRDALHIPEGATEDAERRVRQEEMRQQEADALERNVLWSAETQVAAHRDVQMADPQDTIVSAKMDQRAIGTRAEDGEVRLAENAGRIQHIGQLSDAVDNLQDMVDRMEEDFEETQPLQSQTQTQTQQLPPTAPGPETMVLQEMARALDQIDEETIPSLPERNTNPLPSDITMTTGDEEEEPHPPLECACGDPEHDSGWISCDHCAKVYHLACAGFKSHEDPRIPEVFECFLCHWLAHPRSELCSEADKTQLRAYYQALCLKRRALLVVRDEPELPKTFKQWSTRLGCATPTAEQIVKFLKAEGFLGYENDRAMGTDSTNVQKKQRKTALKASTKGPLVSMWYRKSTAAEKYFEPGGTVELKLLPAIFTEQVVSPKRVTRSAQVTLPPRSGTAPTENTQRAHENFTPQAAEGARKRKGRQESSPPHKKYKASVAAAGIDTRDGFYSAISRSPSLRR